MEKERITMKEKTVYIELLRIMAAVAVILIHIVAALIRKLLSYVKY